MSAGQSRRVVARHSRACVAAASCGSGRTSSAEPPHPRSDAAQKKRGRSPGPSPSLLRSYESRYAFLWQSAHFWGPLASFLWHSLQVRVRLVLVPVLLKPSISPPAAVSVAGLALQRRGLCGRRSRCRLGLEGDGVRGAAADAVVATRGRRRRTAQRRSWSRVCSWNRGRTSPPGLGTRGALLEIHGRPNKMRQ